MATAAEHARGATILEEARRLVSTAAQARVNLRVLGGVAIHLRAGSAVPSGLSRSFSDIDLLCAPKEGHRVARFLEAQGYAPDTAFNAVQGAHRQLYEDQAEMRKVDVFVGTFRMCHEVPIGDRLTVDPTTLPLAELLLTKLQVIELNEKDRNDLYVLLSAHDVGERDGDQVNVRRIAHVCARDWGLYRTLELNLGRMRDGLASAPLSVAQRARVEERRATIVAAMDAEPKSARWRMRARIGDRVRWYEQPEAAE